MNRLPWSQRWPLVAMLGGAGLGAVGMVAAQVAMGTIGQVVFTGLLALAFLFGVWLLVRGQVTRLTGPPDQRTPDAEPLKMVVIALMVTAIVMWLTAAYGIFIAAITTRPENKWHALAYLGVALAATGATWMMRRARNEWADRHLRPWPRADDDRSV